MNHYIEIINCFKNNKKFTVSDIKKKLNITGKTASIKVNHLLSIGILIDCNIGSGKRNKELILNKNKTDEVNKILVSYDYLNKRHLLK